MNGNGELADCEKFKVFGLLLAQIIICPFPNPTFVSARSGVTAMQWPWPFAKGKGDSFILVEGCLPGFISVLLKYLVITEGSEPDLVTDVCVLY